MTFAEQLKSHRQRLGLTQSEVADALEVSARVHWDWENGRTFPPKVMQEGVLARLEKLKIKKD
jgi:transcriptional regulator with XRE-family HTH domain